MFILIFGIAVLALGIHAFKNPDSWMFRRLGNTSEPSDSQMAYTRVSGIATLILGVMLILGGFLNLIN